MILSSPAWLNIHKNSFLETLKPEG
jgi:hypothetical protein